MRYTSSYECRRHIAQTGPRFDTGQSIKSYRMANVLENLFTQVDNVEIQLATHRIVNGLGNNQSLGIGEAFDKRGDIDSVAIGVTRREENVAYVHTDTELEIRFFPELILNLHCASDGIDRAGECHERSVAGIFEPFAVMAEYDCFQDSVGAVNEVESMLLIRIHQCGKTDHVGNHHGGEAAIGHAKSASRRKKPSWHCAGGNATAGRTVVTNRAVAGPSHRVLSS